MKLKHGFKAIAAKLGYEVRQIDWTYEPNNAALRQDLCEHSREISKHHFFQTQEIVLSLRKKYEKPIFGKAHVLDLLKLLAQCIDPGDTALLGLSQLTHVLQVIEGMEKDGVEDQDLLIAALVHDLGKLLLLTDESPENVICMNRPIGKYERGIGLNNCYFQWNHDEFIYSRLKDYLPEHIAWLVRYHGILIPESEPYMNEKDRSYLEKYLRIFRKYDTETKSPYQIPKKKIEDYQDLIHLYFPKPVLF